MDSTVCVWTSDIRCKAQAKVQPKAYFKYVGVEPLCSNAAGGGGFSFRLYFQDVVSLHISFFSRLNFRQPFAGQLEGDGGAFVLSCGDGNISLAA